MRNKRKEACRKNGRPLWGLSDYPHRLATHDFFNLEQRHQYAEKRTIILQLFYLFRLQM